MMSVDFDAYLLRNPSFDEHLETLRKAPEGPTVPQTEEHCGTDSSEGSKGKETVSKDEDLNGHADRQEKVFRLSTLNGCVSCAAQNVKMDEDDDCPDDNTQMEYYQDDLTKPAPYEELSGPLRKIYIDAQKVPNKPLQRSGWSDSDLDLSKRSKERAAEETKTPRRKRRVSFADESGFPLEEVKLLVDENDNQNKIFTDQDPNVPTGLSKMPYFSFESAQPMEDFSRFMNYVHTYSVALENVLIEGNNVLGTIRVLNLAFEKAVFVRFTCNSWITYTDINATYVPDTGNCVSTYDMFSFRVCIPTFTAEVEFAICYRVASNVFWDNNGDENYRLVNLAARRGGLSDTRWPR